MESNFTPVITAIPNQPINFTGSLLDGCLCGDIEPPLLFDLDEDRLIFHLGYQVCAGGANLIDNPDFVGANWTTKGLGWTISAGRACGGGVALASIGDSSFTPVPGTLYVITVDVGTITGTASFSVGGFTAPITSAGPVTYSFTAVSVAQFVLVLPTADDYICLRSVSVYEATTDIVVDILDSMGSVVGSFDPAGDPDNFIFDGTRLVFDATLGGLDLSGCFTVRVTETCGTDETILTSQQLTTASVPCSVKLRACAGMEALGFANYPLEIRLDAKLVKPVWEYDVSDERRSNGRNLRHYADSQRRMEFRVGLQSEFVHPFLAVLPLFPHVYIGQDEYSFDAEEYAPLYGDVFDGTGGVVMTVRPKQELLRVVLCGPEPDGCPPPPNLWVQGTGPNNDLILTEDGRAVLLND